MITSPVQSIPIPLEVSYFLNDGVKTDDDVNTYIFQYPKEWLTSDKGEMIIGVRTISLIKVRRKLEFRFKIRKYFKYAYDELKREHPDWSDDKIYENIDTSESAYVEFDVVSWIPVDKDLRELYIDFLGQAKAVFAEYNEKYELNRVKFKATNPADVYDKDVQMDGYYDKKENCFIETIFSPRNDISRHDSYYVDIALDFDTKYDEKGKLIRTDFMDVFNIGDGPFENNPEQYKKFQRQMNFKYVWDRHSCKVCSSFVSETKRNYIGDSQSLFNPIKYYKVNSTNDTFTLSFYSARHPDFPVKLPENENMVMELQFMQHSKLLYI